jgi:hypothetical protein
LFNNISILIDEEDVKVWKDVPSVDAFTQFSQPLICFQLWILWIALFDWACVLPLVIKLICQERSCIDALLIIEKEKRASTRPNTSA